MQSANILRKGTANFIMGFCSWRKLKICVLALILGGIKKPRKGKI